jgi:hypothetical protein
MDRNSRAAGFGQSRGGVGYCHLDCACTKPGDTLPISQGVSRCLGGRGALFVILSRYRSALLKQSSALPKDRAVHLGPHLGLLKNQSMPAGDVRAPHHARSAWGRMDRLGLHGPQAVSPWARGWGSPPLPNEGNREAGGYHGGATPSVSLSMLNPSVIPSCLPTVSWCIEAGSGRY